MFQQRLLTPAVVLLLTSVTAPSYAASDDCASTRARRALERQNAPPTSIFTDENYIVGPTATGAFAGHEHDWARYNGSTWTFEDADPCDVVYLASDYVRTLFNSSNRPILDSTLIFDDGAWQTVRRGYQRVDLPNNANVVITTGDFLIQQPLRMYKDDNALEYTYTLPANIEDFGPAQLAVSNIGSVLGSVKVVVASSGTINGLSELKVEKNSTVTFTFVRFQNGVSEWHAH